MFWGCLCICACMRVCPGRGILCPTCHCRLLVLTFSTSMLYANLFVGQTVHAYALFTVDRNASNDTDKVYSLAVSNTFL